MEKLKPLKGKSPISSLKFQQKSDFKKFLNFIKNQTEELKGIAEPKESKVQSLLGVAGTGLGILGIGALLLGGKKRDDEFETAKGLDGGVDLYAAIGRRNQPGIKTSPLRAFGKPVTTRKGAENPDAFIFDEGTRTSVTRGRSFEETKKLKINPSESEIRAKDIREGRRKIKKKFKTKQLVKVGEVGGDSTIPDYMKKNIEAGKKIEKKIIEKKPSIKINPLKIDPLKAFKSADEKLLADFMNAPDPEADALRDAASKTSPPPDVDDFYRGQKYEMNRKKPISRRFKNLREGVMGATDRDPSGRVTDTLSRKTFPEKSGFAKFTRKLLRRPNPKMTKDTSRLLFGLGYKNPNFSILSKAVNNPAAKVVFFGLDIFNAVQSGKQVFNLKDNLGTALYDLYVSINNKIFENDPEKLKIYRSESSDERLFMKQFQRNMNIIKRQNDAAQQKFLEAKGTGSNNIIVIPQNQQKTNMGGGNNISSTIAGSEGLVPFEPLNIGDDILLHKLNQ